ncbi:GNAT family N-acetyltransferase [Melghirimyces algeriensis]|uniref:GNAT family N-acetyltransferase n=1 Tax=Melghirimyces algeriensis TaxID=910412 RepID=UPI003CCC7CDF
MVNKHPHKEAFIYDFLIFEDAQGRGWGQNALQALEEHVGKHGVKKISLHVFAHNKRAIHLYQKLNYQATNIYMSKWLG